MAAQEWQRRVYLTRQNFPDLSEKFADDASFIESVRKKHYKEVDKNTFLTSFFQPEPEVAAPKEGLGDALRTAATDLFVSDKNRTQPAVEPAAPVAVKPATSLLDRAFANAPADAVEEVPPEVQAARARLANNPQALARFDAGLAAEKAQRDAYKQKYEAAQNVPQKVQNFVSNQIEALDTIRAAGLEDEARRQNPPIKSRFGMPREPSYDERVALLQQAEELRKRAQVNSEYVAAQPKAETPWDVATDIAVPVAGTLAEGYALGPAGLVGRAAKPAAIAFGASVASQTGNVNRNFVESGYNPREAVRKSLIQAAVEVPIDTLLSVVPGASRIVSGLVQGSGNLLSSELSNAAIGREMSQEERALSFVGGVAGGVASPNSAKSIATDATEFDKGMAAAKAATEQAKATVTTRKAKASSQLKELTDSFGWKSSDAASLLRERFAARRAAEQAPAARETPQGYAGVENRNSLFETSTRNQGPATAAAQDVIPAIETKATSPKPTYVVRPEQDIAAAKALDPRLNREAQLTAQDAIPEAETARIPQSAETQRIAQEYQGNTPSLPDVPKRMNANAAILPEQAPDAELNTIPPATPYKSPEELALTDTTGPAFTPPISKREELRRKFEERAAAKKASKEKTKAELAEERQKAAELKALQDFAATPETRGVPAAEPPKAEAVAEAPRKAEPEDTYDPNDMGFDVPRSGTGTKAAPRTAKDVEDEVTAGWDREAGAARDLRAAGNLVVFEGDADLKARFPEQRQSFINAMAAQRGIKPEHVEAAIAKHGKEWFNGLYDPKTGKVWLNAHTLPKGGVKPKILHEATVHGWAELDEARLKSFDDSLRKLEASGSKHAVEARKEAERLYPKASDSRKAAETLANFAERVFAARSGKGIVGSARNLYNDVIATMKRVVNAGLQKMGMKGFKYTDADLLHALRSRNKKGAAVGEYAPKKGDITSARAAASAPSGQVYKEAAFSFADDTKAVAKKAGGRIASAFKPQGGGDKAVLDVLNNKQFRENETNIMLQGVWDKFTEARRNNPAAETTIDDYMRGKNDGSTLPRAVKAAVDDFRAVSKQTAQGFVDIIDREIAAGRLSKNSPEAKRRDAIVANLDTYVRRVYRAKRDPKFQAALKEGKGELQGVWDQALDHIKREWTVPADIASRPVTDQNRLSARWGLSSKLTPAERLSKLVEISTYTPQEMDEYAKAIRHSLTSFKEKGINTQYVMADAIRRNMSALMEKDNVPLWLRKLWGEYKDPTQLALHTLKAQRDLLTQTEALIALKDMPDLVSPNERPKGEGWVQLEGDGYGILDKSYVKAENKAMFEDFINGMPVGMSFAKSPGARFLQQLTGYLKRGQIVYNVGSAVAQGLSNTMGLLQTGTLFKPSAYRHIGTAVRAGAKSAWELPPKADLEFLKLTNKLGVLGDGAVSVELNRFVKQLEDSDPNIQRDTFDKLKQVGGKILDVHGGLFRWTDEFPKVWEFLSNVDDMRAAYPQKTDAEIAKLAADRTRAGTITFSKQGRLVKSISNKGVIFPFTTFIADSVRASVANAVMAVQDIKKGVSEGNTALRDAGIRRAMGTMLVNGGLATMLSYGFQGDEKDKDLRSQMPYYHKHGSYVGGGLDENDNISYTSLDRYSPSPITAGFFANALRGDVEGMAASIFEPMLSRGIGIDELVKIADTAITASKQPLSVQESKELWRAVENLGWMAVPSKTLADTIRVAAGETKQQEEGTFSAAEKAGQMLGVTTSKIVPTHGTGSALARATYDYKNSYDVMRNSIKEYVLAHDDIAQEDLNEVVREAVAKDREAFGKYAESVQAIGRLAYKDKKEIEQALKEWELTSRESVKKALFTGKYSVPDMSADLYKSIEKSGLSKAVGKDLREKLKTTKYTKELERKLKVAFDNARKEA